jgi:integrase
MGAIHKLSQKQITTCGDGMFSDGGNLYFKRAGNAASWVFRYVSIVDHRSHDLGLGKWPEVSIEKARKRAFAYRCKIADGIDVAAEHKRVHRAAVIAAAPVVKPIGYTFKKAAAEFIKSQEAGWTPASTVQWTQSLQDYAFPVIGSMSIGKIDTDHVLRVLKPIWETKHETASRVRGRIERVLDWASAKKLRTGENPARWDGHVEHLLANGVKRVEHFEAVPVKDVPEFMRRVRALDRVPARALELLALTATRKDEVRCAVLGEFDLDAETWTIPAERTKTRTAHTVPLSPRAVEIVRTQAAGRGASGYVFTGARTGGLMGTNVMKHLMEEISGAGATLHGLRSSFRDWCGQRGVPRELAELCLAHVVGSKVERAYRRDPLVEQRREIMDAWAEYCGG